MSPNSVTLGRPWHPFADASEQRGGVRRLLDGRSHRRSRLGPDVVRRLDGNSSVV